MDSWNIIDRSTNGTFVTVGQEAEIALYREEMMLRGEGFILLGHGAQESGEGKIYFQQGGYGAK